MNVDWSKLGNDAFIAIIVASVRAMFILADAKSRKRENLLFVFFNWIGGILFAVIVGYITDKMDVEYFHKYHDIIVALSAILGKVAMDKVEVWFKKKKIEDVV